MKIKEPQNPTTMNHKKKLKKIQPATTTIEIKQIRIPEIKEKWKKNSKLTDP